MIVNYDKKNGWSSVFDGGIDSLFKGALNKNDASFVKNIKTIQNSLGTVSSKNIDRLANSIGGVNQELINSAKAVRSGEQSWADFDTTVTKVTKSTSKFSTLTAKAGSALKSFGASVLSMGANMLAGFAIGAVISTAISAIDDYIHRNERLIEAGEEAKSSIEETFNAFSDSKTSITDLGKSLSDNADDIKTTGDAIDSLAEKYTKLRDGVNWSDNSNKFLSDEDYQSYLDISNQIADQFPSLVSGYDAQGNAILNLGNNASTAASQLTELYNASMLSANVEIGNQLNDRYSGVEAQIKEYQDEINVWEKDLEQSKKQINKLTPSVDDVLSGDIAYVDGLEDELDAVLDKYDLSSRKYYADDGLGSTTPMINTRDISEEAAQAISDVFSINTSEIEQKIAANKQLIQDQWDSMAESVGQYLQTSPSFSELDSTLQNAFLGNISELDISQIGSEYGGDVQQFLYSEILNPLTDMKPEAQQALADLLQFDPSNMNISEYSDLVSKAFSNAFPNDSELQNQMRKTFGFDSVIEDAEHQANALKEVLGENFTDVIDSMSLDELEKGYDIVINGDEAISTVDELRDKIEQTQALSATSVDLNVRTNMDAIESALESANAGADYENAISYLEQAKDLFDKGLVGTDDFKSIAAYLSPTGSDDPINFAENYSKALRYLTEDGQGVQNFLEDLQSKGLASMETLSDGTQKWKYNIDDLQDAANEMGIGFEFMMDMFGRLEDYGFSNNFVGSVEDGAQRLNDLYTQLAQEEAKLSQLQAEGANTTAIEQQQEKVNALKNDITETKDAMEQLVASSADEYAEQVSTAKQTISSLAEERNKILNDNTYGADTQTVADLMEKQIQQIAGENGLELDANLNIKEPEEPPEIEVDAKPNLEIDPNAEGTFDDNPQVTVTFKAEIDGEEFDINKFTDQEGEIHYTTNVNDIEVELDAVEHQDGTITYEPNYEKTLDNLDVEATVDYLIGEQEDPEVKQAFVDYIKNHQDDPDFRTAFVDYLKAGQDDPDAKSALLDYILRDQENPIDGKVADMYYNSTGQDAPEDKTAGVWYTIKGVIGNVADFLTGGSGLSGTAHIDGTVGGLYPIPQLSGRALAMGTLQDDSVLNPKWRTKHTEIALTGEEGPELVVTRANRWFTVGDHGAEFSKIPQGSVIFNARQTKDLFEKGRINSRGTAMISGTAYAGGSGGGSFFVGGSGSSSGMSGRPSNSSKKSSAEKSADKASKSAEKAADKFEEIVDSIETLLDRMDRTLQRLTDSIETYSYDLSKQSSVSDKAMNTIRTNLTTLQQAYNRYIKEANSVGLSDSWKKRVQNGAIDITTITDENLADQLSEYQDWWVSRQCKIFLMLGTPKSLIYHNVGMKYAQA